MAGELEGLEQYAMDVISGRRRGFRADLLRLLLRGLARIYAGLVSLRLRLYRERVMQSHHLGVPVVSIGNLTVGGTGKTPVVELFARELRQGGRRVAVLSRGYKSELPHSATLPGEDGEIPPRVVSDGKEILLESLHAGDEPYMLAKNLPGVPVVVDRDRVKAGRYAVRHMGADVLVLDDGLQYLKLGRRLDVVLIDRTQPFGNGFLLPRGTLREPPASLRRAHLILLTKCDGRDNSALVRRIRRHNRAADIVECRHCPIYLQNQITGERIGLEHLRGTYVGAISGIAVPTSFEEGLRKLGATVEVTRCFTDHHRYELDEIERFIDRCIHRDVEMIVTTEKDSVRFPWLTSSAVPMYFLRVEIEILKGQEAWQKHLARLCTPPAYRAPILSPSTGDKSWRGWPAPA